MSSLIPQQNQTVSTHTSSEGAEPVESAVSHLPRINFGEILHAFRRRLWVVFACMIVGVSLAIYYANQLPVLFQSFGSLNIKTSTPQIFEESPIGREESTALEQMKTVEQGLLSSTVLLRVAEKNNLAEDPIYRAAGTDPQAILEVLRGRLTIELRKGSRLLDITTLDTDPQRAAQLVEDIVTEYEGWKDQGRNELIEKASSGLASETEKLKLRMQDSDVRLNEFRELHPVLGLSGQQEQLLSNRLDSLGAELSSTTAERIKVEAESRAVQATSGLEGTSTMLASKGVRGQFAIELEQQIAAKRAEFAVLKERYLPKHYKYIDAAEELARLEESLTQVIRDAEVALESDLEMVQAREAQLADMVADAKQEALNDEKLREEFALLTREAEINRTLHATVSTRLQQLQIGSSLNASLLSWDERPFAATKAKSPRKKVLAAAGLFLGGLLGVFLGLVLELADPKVRESSAVERKLHLPILASLPTYTRQVVSDLSVVVGPGDPALRPAHLARYASTSHDGNSRMETLMFASQFDGDGKTLCALKCARTLVKQGYRTLLIDADFRVPGLSRSYSEQRQGRHGLAAYLAEEAEAAEVLFETGLPGLWFMPTGEESNMDGDLLAGPGFRALLDAVEPMFDRLIIDITSIKESDDVQAVARYVGATYLVARKGRGKYRDLKDAASTLQSAGANLAGFIWNEGSTRGRRKDQGPFIEPTAYPAARESVSEELPKRATG